MNSAEKKSRIRINQYASQESLTLAIFFVLKLF